MAGYDVRGWCRRFGLSRCKVMESSGPSGVSMHLVDRYKPTEVRMIVSISRARDDAGPSADIEMTVWTPQHVQRTSTLRLRDHDWDPDEVQALMLSGIAFVVLCPESRSGACSSSDWMDSMRSILVRSYEMCEFRQRLPQSLLEMQCGIGGGYGVVMDMSFKAAVSTIKDMFDKYQDRLSEEEVLDWFRASTVKHVLDR